MTFHIFIYAILGSPTIFLCLDLNLIAGTWFLVLGTENLFATKWVHVKHYGLKIGGPNCWWDSAFLLNSTNPEITWVGPKFQGCVILGKKWSLPGMPRDSSEWVFTQIGGFPGFGSKDLLISNPKDAKTKNDAMVNVYPLGCPKPIILLNKMKTRKDTIQPQIHISNPILTYFARYTRARTNGND